MKRFAKCYLIPLMVLILLISGCGASTAEGVQSVLDSGGFSTPNFNNDYLVRLDFWAFGDIAFYEQDGFYNMGFWVEVDGTKEKLFEESDFSSDSWYVSVDDFYVCKDSVYFVVTYYEREGLEFSHAALCCYDLNTYTYETVLEVPCMFRWVVVEPYLIYSTIYDGCDKLAVCDLKTGEETVVCEDIAEFGVVENELRYITGNGRYELYRCGISGGTVEKLGEFDCVYDEEYDFFNFTPDAVVMYNYSTTYDEQLVVYYPETDHTAVYRMPLEIQCMVACREYAFVLLCGSSDMGSGIYRVKLSDGSYEKVVYSDNGYSIYAASDSEVYMIRGVSNWERISVDP